MLDDGPRCSCSRLRRCYGGCRNVQGRQTSNRLRRNLEGRHPLCTQHVRIRRCKGTAWHGKPALTGLGTLPRRRRGATCLPHMYQTKYCECQRRSTLTPLVVNNLGWLVEDLVDLLRTPYSPPLREGPMVSVQQSHRGSSH